MLNIATKAIHAIATDPRIVGLLVPGMARKIKAKPVGTSASEVSTRLEGFEDLMHLALAAGTCALIEYLHISDLVTFL
jgi:hypothetical protein